MADLQSSHQDLYTAIVKIWTDDANDLGGGIVSKGVRDMVRDGDPRSDTSSNYIVLRITGSPDDAFEVYREKLTVLFTIWSQNDNTFTEQDTIDHQLRLLYHRATLLDGSNWAFGQMFIGRGYQDQPKDGYNRFVRMFEVSATKA